MWKSNRNKETSLTKSSPRPLDRWRGDWEQAMERFFRDPFFSPSFGFGRQFFRPADDFLMPRMNVAESQNEVRVDLEVPGVNPDDIQIDVTGDTLTVRGEKCASKEEGDGGYHYNECEYGSFFRSIDLPSGVDAENVNATCKNGMLSITMKKRPEAQPKRIEVRGDGKSVAANTQKKSGAVQTT